MTDTPTLRPTGDAANGLKPITLKVFFPSAMNISVDRAHWYLNHAIRGYWRQFCQSETDPIRMMSKSVPVVLPASPTDAADLAAARARIAELEGALEPFARAADVKLCGADWKDSDRFGQTDVTFYLTFGDLRKARAVLPPKGGDNAG